MIKVFKDIFNYYHFKKKESDFRVGFFCENKFIFEYVKPYILKKAKKQKIIILSFEDLNYNFGNKIIIFSFYTKFFRKLIFLTLKLGYLYSSTPDLNQSIFQKSRVSKCKYIYLQHSPASLTMIYNSQAFDAFDAVQAINIYQFNEMKEIILKKNLKSRVFKGKYLFLSDQKKINENFNYHFDLLIAPTWNSNFYKLNCHLILNELLSKHNISYVLRPHPMSLKKKEISLIDLNKLNIKFDISRRINLNSYKFLISDWSGIFIEFAILTKRKSLLVNTPKKILNKNYTNYDQVPIEISLRNVFGTTFEVNELEKLVNELIEQKNKFNNKPNLFKDKNIQKCIEKDFFI